VPIEKQADTRTALPGGFVGYRITVRNRGLLAERNLQVCDRIPRGMTFVGASRKLFRLSGRRCLTIAQLAPGRRVSFRVLLHVDANAPPGMDTNIVEETPGVQPPRPPELGVLPEKTAPIPAAERAKAAVRVRRARVRARRPAASPRFTG
jgi:uncharacterized repeat protein (TIGR01451 family)